MTTHHESSEQRAPSTARAAEEAKITIDHLTMAYGSFVVQNDLSFSVRRGDIFVIMGDSGCGKSTLLRHMLGLKAPAQGRVLYDGESFTDASPERQRAFLLEMGVLYQSGALWSSMTLAENVGLALREHTDLDADDIQELASLKLALVGLSGFESYYPSEISGGMRKRAGLARAIALDPEMLFFDEPSAGLDPISARRLDDLILEIRDSLGSTVVVVTHELASIFAIADDSVFLDAEEKRQTGLGSPHALLADPPTEKIHRFLTRGESADRVGQSERTGEQGES